MYPAAGDGDDRDMASKAYVVAGDDRRAVRASSRAELAAVDLKQAFARLERAMEFA
jgi:hypothetical protein